MSQSPKKYRNESQKSSGRKPLNTMNGIQNIQRSISPFREPGSAKSTQHKALTLLTDYTKTRLLQEIELIYKECQKARDIEQFRSQIPYQKLQHHDPEKWKKKFKLLLDREKIIAFDGVNPSIDIKRMKFKGFDQITPLKPLGKTIIGLAKFWVLYLTLCGVKQLENGMDDIMQHVEDTIDNREVLQRFLPAMPEEEEEIEQAPVQEIEITEQEACVKEALINTVIENEEQVVEESYQEEQVVVKENPFEEENVVESNSNVEQNEVTNPGNTTAQFMCEQEIENYDKVSEESSKR